MGEALSRPTGLLEGIQESLRLTNEAIGVLDSVGAPGDIAAHLDLAGHRMERTIEQWTDRS